MDERRYIISMENHKLLHCGTLDNLLFIAEANRIVHYFTVPVKPNLLVSPCSEKSSDYNSHVEASSSQKDPKPPSRIQSHIAAIPDELILMICEILDLSSCFRLSLVSTRFWRICWPLFKLKISEFMGPFAGKRVICLGETCEVGDLPASFLTTEEEIAIDQHSSRYRGFYPNRGTLLGFAIMRFSRVGLEIKPYDRLTSKWSRGLYPSIYHVLKEAKHLPNQLRAQVHRFARRPQDELHPPTESWILCNLTTAEFVQGDELYAAFHPSKRGRRLDAHPGFGEVIMCRICWSSPASRDPFNRGLWAGHRLEICTAQVHATKSDSSWKDVTSEVIDELSAAMKLPTRRSLRTRY